MVDTMPPDAMSLRIARKAEIAHGIYLFELQNRARADLPSFTAGAHVKLRTPRGFVRKYSMCKDPGERNRYTIAVKREMSGRGGSIDLVDHTRVDDMLLVAPPNDFELPPRAADLLFIAGGIGITPIMARIHQLQSDAGKRFRLYYCTRAPEMTAFLPELSAPALKGKVRIHHDAGDSAQARDLWPILEQRRNREHLYCCGPRSLMAIVRDLAGHWSSTSVHFEALASRRKLSRMISRSSSSWRGRGRVRSSHRQEHSGSDAFPRIPGAFFLQKRHMRNLPDQTARRRSRPSRPRARRARASRPDNDLCFTRTRPQAGD